MTPKTLAVFVSCFLFLGILIQKASAQTPTATDSASTIRDSVKQKVTEELAQIKQGVAKKGFIGSIVTVSDASISLTGVFGQTHKILVAADTTIKLANGADGTPGDLKAGQYILAMGDVDSQDTMTSKRLLVVAKPDAETRTVVFGTITKSTTSSFMLGTDTYKFTAATKFANKAKATDLQIGAKVTAIINNGTATRLLISVPAPTATTTPTASVSATPKP
jgi:hypothetical protein